MDIDECINLGYLKRIKPSQDLVEKELKEAKYDIDMAEGSYNNKDYKWSTIKAYYAIFHSARAVLFKLGFQEKRHFAISIVLEDLNKKGKLEIKYINYFNAALSSREDADYHYISSKERAHHNIELAKEFYNKMLELTK